MIVMGFVLRLSHRLYGLRLPVASRCLRGYAGRARGRRVLSPLPGLERFGDAADQGFRFAPPLATFRDPAGVKRTCAGASRLAEVLRRSEAQHDIAPSRCVKADRSAPPSATHSPSTQASPASQSASFAHSSATGSHLPPTHASRGPQSTSVVHSFSSSKTATTERLPFIVIVVVGPVPEASSSQ